jgi:hypothetical protein
MARCSLLSGSNPLKFSGPLPPILAMQFNGSLTRKFHPLKFPEDGVAHGSAKAYRYLSIRQRGQ